MFKNIRFVRWHGPYQSGQWAKFPTEEAEELIRAGRAVEHDADKPNEMPPKRGTKMVQK